MRTRWLAMGFLLLLGCNSTGVGNPPVVGLPTGVTRVAVTSDKGHLLDRRFLPEGSFVTAVVTIREFAAVPCDPREATQRFVGPFEVDLERVESFALPDIVHTESGICSLQLSMAAGDADAQYPGEWLHAEASFDDYRVTIAQRGQFDLVLRTRDDARWGLPGEDVASSVVIALRPELWLTRDEVVLLADAEGELIVNEQMPLLSSALRLRMRKETTILWDLDGDRMIDEIERGLDGILALGE